MKRNNAFTLIELLVVIAIIAILAAILFPVFTQAKAAAKKTTDISNFKQQGIAMAMYTGDSDGGLPMSNTGGLCSQVRGWGFGPPDSVPAQTMQPYMKNFQVTVCPNDSFSLQQRLVDHQPNWPSGHTIATATQAEKDYAYGVRSNIGYNYEFLSPWRYIRPPAVPATVCSSAMVNESEMNAPSNTIAFVNAIWDRRAGSGEPTGGGNWVVETPCWRDPAGNFLRPMAQYSNAGGDDTLYSYISGGVATSWFGSNDWLVYGGTWPFHNQTPVAGFAGLKTGQMVTMMTDTSVKARALNSLLKGCSPTGSQAARVSSTEDFLWDLD